MEYLLLIEHTDGKTSTEQFWTEARAQERKAKVLTHQCVKYAWLYKMAE